MNESGDYIFSCDYIRNFQLNGWFGEPESKDLNACDCNKLYTSCFMGINPLSESVITLDNDTVRRQSSFIRRHLFIPAGMVIMGINSFSHYYMQVFQEALKNHILI